MTGTHPGGDRADARRNRARVLTAATEAFTADGLDVSLGTIAHRAGVGAGTVYRHFPSKQALLESVLVRTVDDLAACGRRRAAAHPPTEAFFAFLHDIVERSRGGGHVCDAVIADGSWPHPLLTASRRRFGHTLTTLLDVAQRAGGVRTDVGPDDVTALATGCAAILAAHPDRAAGLRLVTLTLDTLRTCGTVTKAHHLRDDPCAECGTPLPHRPTGRPARYCGATCRQRARRRRLAP
ncbi:TetR/AcrR family transcriptional regulator [Streptomyces sp. NPDC058953]|uniref:TetR/AcrR family transcriptional regulator n=1 Tax=Streptomyces sp. NPDC058953 TaxID=3346676 RepID=UPI00368FBDDC